MLKWFRKPSPLDIAKAELEEAQRELLVAQTHAEYYNNMVRYQSGRIMRLQQTCKTGAQ